MQRSSLFSFITSTLCLSLSACAFKKDEGPSEEDKKISRLEAELDANRPLVKEDFKYEFIPNEKLGEYTTRISWPGGRPLQVKVLQKGLVLRTLDGRYENSTELPCEVGQVAYTLSVVSTKTGTLSEPSFILRCPIDLSLDQSSSDTEQLKHVDGRLQLKNGANILISETDLDLNLRELIIDGSATIRTLDVSRHADVKNYGTFKAPVIRINAKKASGLLKLELNGLDGRPVGDLIDEVNPALDGAAGAAGTGQEVCPHEKYSRAIGEMVSGGPCRFVCLTNPQNGLPGLQPTEMINGKLTPKTGQTGRDGIAGVGTSKVDLQIDDASKLQVDIAFNPGLASAPGHGALPKGGNGGPPGANPNGACTPASTGSSGQPGLRGADGAPAPNGRCEGVYVSASVIDKVKMENVNQALPCSTIPGIVQVGKLSR